MLESAEKYLRKQEWSMGNGQCPECCGCSPKIRWGRDVNLGHKSGCALNAALQEIAVLVEAEYDRNC